MAWLFARSFEAVNQESDEPTITDSSQSTEEDTLPDQTVVDESGKSKCLSAVPTWSAFNSCLSDTKAKTKYGPLPLLYAPAHEWSTLITVLKQAQHISCHTTGVNSKAVVTLDMQLYEKAKKLQLHREDCKDKWVLRVGELHTVMAALRTIGSAIEGSGLDDCWVESDLYGPATVRQILECGHMKRSLTAHMISLQALFALYKEEFFTHNPELESKYVELMNEFNARDLSKTETVKELNNRLKFLIEKEINPKLDQFSDEKQTPTFRFMTMYMNMILSLLSFIRATRDGLWSLHLASLEHFTRFFFAFDRLKYARMIPVYLADMKRLKESDPDIWNEFERGNFVVNKSNVPFCAIGADHGIEHVNRSMKVSGGLVGITLNEAARSRFFLVAPELSRLAQEAKTLINLKPETDSQHHESSPSFARNQSERVMKLKDEIANHANPFKEDGTELVTLVTKSVMPEKVTNDLVNAEQIGISKHTSFVEKRIASNTENIWAPMKKTKLNIWTSVNRKTKMKVADQVIELKCERSLFARLVVVAKSRPDIDIKESIGKFEFTTFPRSVFDGSGNLLPATNKSQLMGIIETYAEKQMETKVTASDLTPKTCIIDGMALVQEMGKPLWISTCLDLSNHFLQKLELQTKEYEEIHLVFDRYDIDISLKAATRMRRLAGTDRISYHITDTTAIKAIPMKKLLSHTRTKDRLCEYLAHKAMLRYTDSEKVFVVAYKSMVMSNKPGFEMLSSTHEEADTKLILHAHHAARNGSNIIDIHSPDTDVFILALRRANVLAPTTSFVTGTGSAKRSIPLNAIHRCLGPAIADALPGFHAFTGCDQTGKFAGKGKLLFWKALISANEEILETFQNLGLTETLSEESVQALEKFVCKTYAPAMNVENLSQLRWKLFSKRQAEGEKLPPTLATLKQAVFRAHYQSMIWQRDIEPNPVIPSPDNYGWKREGDRYVAVSSELPAAPDAVVQLVRCTCSKSGCSTSCSCRKHNMNCTEMCECEGDLDVCRNVYILNTDLVLEDLEGLEI